MLEHKTGIKETLVLETLDSMGGKQGIKGGLSRLIQVQFDIALDKKQGKNALTAFEKILVWGGFTESNMEASKDTSKSITIADARKALVELQELERTYKLVSDNYTYRNHEPEAIDVGVIEVDAPTGTG
ncbi:MAG: hypothetical protein JRE40_02985 [Deltaproteobacteria bacterium]|nr:hypothetical protein [Deltaproteobacteria bacterium]